MKDVPNMLRDIENQLKKQGAEWKDVKNLGELCARYPSLQHPMIPPAVSNRWVAQMLERAHDSNGRSLPDDYNEFLTYARIDDADFLMYLEDRYCPEPSCCPIL